MVTSCVQLKSCASKMRSTPSKMNTPSSAFSDASHPPSLLQALLAGVGSGDCGQSCPWQPPAAGVPTGRAPLAAGARLAATSAHTTVRHQRRPGLPCPMAAVRLGRACPRLGEVRVQQRDSNADENSPFGRNGATHQMPASLPDFQEKDRNCTFSFATPVSSWSVVTRARRGRHAVAFWGKRRRSEPQAVVQWRTSL